MIQSSKRPISKPTLLQRYTDLIANQRDDQLASIALDQNTRLQKLDRLMANVVEQSFDGIITIDQHGHVRTANGAAGQLFACSKSVLVGLHIQALFPDLGNFRPVASSNPEDKAPRLEGVACRLDQTTCPVELSFRKLSIDHETWAMAILRDITTVKAHEDKLRHLALHDSLTGLPNRLLLNDRLENALRLARRSSQPLDLAVLDLDRFKEVNDTLGHQVGDSLLILVAERLNECVREGDTIARLGGDEFAVLLPKTTGHASAEDVAERIRAALLKPFSLPGSVSLEIGVSIGLANYPVDADHGEKLMQCADVAMYEAKRNATGIERYDPKRDFNTIRTLVLSGGLRQAIDADQLKLVYQPKLNLHSGAICSFEVLTRWHHPDHGLILPAEFIPQVEESGNIVPFTRWTLERTFECLDYWRNQNINVSLALNLSPRSLHCREIATITEALLGQYAIAPSQIILELTETAVMLDPERAVERLQYLHDMGLRMSIDDFGTGYSSLSLLRRLPVDELKIDKSFIETIVSNPQDKVIVSSTIGLAHSLGLDVVAEGVETEAQLSSLRELGCDIIQGFLISEPIDGNDLDSWMSDERWPFEKIRHVA